MRELEKEAQEWLAKHAVLLGPEELPFEEEKLDEAIHARDGEWPVPCAVTHMGIFADIKDETSFNRIVGDPNNWSIILARSDLYHAWIVPQAIVIFGRTWFNHKQWGNSIRPGPPPSLFGSDDRRAARKAGTTMAETAVGKSVIYRIVSRVEHALDIYLSGGGYAKSGAVKKPGGYIVRSVANEFIQDAGADMGYRLVRVRACPNCLSTRRGRARRSEVKHVGDNLYSCERCADIERNIAITLSHYVKEGTEVPLKLTQEHARALRFSEFSGIVCVCPNDNCQGLFVPIDSVDDPAWWLTEVGILAQETISKMRALKGIQRFREPPEPLLMLPLHCPFCDRQFTPATALASQSGLHGQSGKLTGLPSIFVWVRALDRSRYYNSEADITKLKGALVDDSNVDPSHRIMAEQRVRILVGELALHAQELGNRTAPAIISQCFCEVVSEWMLTHPKDASHYFFDWESGERKSTTIELNRMPNCRTRKTTSVVRGHETAIHQTILYSWLGRISECLHDIRKVKGSKIHSLEDLKWFCRPPAYNGGPKVSFVATVQEGLRIQNESRLVAVGQTSDKPRMVWVVSIYKIDGEGRICSDELVSHIKTCEWQSIRMSIESGLMPNDRVKIVALMMPGHHCHAPIQRIIRLRTSLLSSMIGRIRSEEAGEASDASFWREWQKRTEIARKATGIGIQ
jgi:hypothetical protein